MDGRPFHAYGIGVSLLFSLGSAGVIAQEAITPYDLLKAPGTVIAAHEPVSSRDMRTIMRGGPQITGYAIERVDLGRPRRVELPAALAMITDQAWRVRVYVKNLRLRNMPAIVWIGDKEVGIGVESQDLSNVTAITTDGSIIKDGQSVGISYELDSDHRTVLERPIRLEQKP